LVATPGASSIGVLPKDIARADFDRIAINNKREAACARKLAFGPKLAPGKKDVTVTRRRPDDHDDSRVENGGGTSTCAALFLCKW